MPVLPRLRSLWRNLFRRDLVERDLDAEIDASIALLEDRYVREGMTPAQARRAARIAFGAAQPIRESVRDRRVGAGLDAAAVDARVAWRSLRKAPGFTAVVVTTLALGVGANTAIFSVVHALLIAPLPYRNADRLVFVWSDMTSEGYPRAPLSGPELGDLRTRSTTVASFGAIWANTIALTGEPEPEQLRIGMVTDNFFDVLGAAPALGRSFTASDAVPGARPAILIGWALFERRFAGDPSVVGRQILVNDRPTTVIGVMPASFRLLLPPDSSVPDDLQAWTPFGANLVRGPRGQQFLRVIGRLGDGVTVSAARADVDAIAARISREFPEYGADGRRFTTVALQQDDVRDVKPALLALFAGVGMLLAMACLNIASLLIARAASRSSETALRLALGAGRGRLARQCLTEGALLALLAVGVGLLAGRLALRGLIALRPESLSRIDLARVDGSVIAFTLGIALMWGLLLSLAPLAELFRANLAVALNRPGRSNDAPLRARGRAALVVLQVALTVVLLVGSGLLVRTFARVQQVDPGFQSDSALTFRVSLPFQRYKRPAGFNAFSRQLQSALAAIPGVTGVGAISHVPYDNLPNWGGGYLPETATNRASAPNADYRTVTPGLFEALGVRPREGRLLTEQDDPAAGVNVIVDDRLAARLWPGRSALNQRVLVDPGSTGATAVAATVIGVVPHLRLRSLVADLTEQVFFPERLVQRDPVAYVVRARRPPAALAADVRNAIASLDPKLPIYDVRPLDAYVEAARATRRFTMQLAAAFALLALVLACVGVYGVLAYAVARRRREFGIRLALGAEPRQVVAGVIGEGLAFAAVGAAIGVPVSAAASRLLETQLYGVRPHDPVTYTVALVLLGVAVFAACWIPARRATAASPLDALRAE
jgi:putative ABC transport system permease protein